MVVSTDLFSLSGQGKRNILIALGTIIVVSFIVYLPVFGNELLEWDDSAYIKNNPLVLSFDIKGIFTENVMGNYHPLTVLFYAIEYQLFGLNPAGYHAVNLLLHLINVLLVFYAVLLLSEKPSVALVSALLFGIHPMHVESVAWAAELKDLLYTLFFLGSYILYMIYNRGHKKKFYALALLFFLLSLLSKAMAVSLPLVLILTDYLKGRKIDKNSLIEKVPFFLIALIFGLVAVLEQKSSEAMELSAVLPVSQRIVFASFAFINYLYKLIVPLNLSAFYPYPVNEAGIYVPSHYYLYVLLFAGLSAYILYTARFTRKILFGFGFFALTIVMVLQLLPVGKAVMADRYTYIPAVGIFYLAGEGLFLLWNRNMKTPVILLLVVFSLFFSIKTFSQCKIWKDNMTLWHSVISFDEAVAESYYKGYFFNSGRGNQNPVETKVSSKSNEHLEKSSALAVESRNEEAIIELNKAIEQDPGSFLAYNKRGILYVKENRFEEAVKDFSRAIELKSDYAEAYNNRGIVLHNEKKFPEALRDFNKAVELKDDYALAYNNRGNVLFEEKKFEEAIDNYTRAIAIKNDYAQAYYKRGLAESYSGRKELACVDLEKAVNLGYFPAAEAYGKICNNRALNSQINSR